MAAADRPNHAPDAIAGSGTTPRRSAADDGPRLRPGPRLLRGRPFQQALGGQQESEGGQPDQQQRMSRVLPCNDAERRQDYREHAEPEDPETAGLGKPPMRCSQSTIHGMKALAASANPAASGR